MDTVLTIVEWGLVAIAALTVIFGSLFTVEQQSAAIIERFGKYRRTAHAGLNLKLPLIDRVAARVSLKVQELIVDVDTKTKDNVFVKVPVAVQYQVVEGKEADSHYKLTNAPEQMQSYVLNVVRAQVPGMPLDQVFEKQDDVGKQVDTELGNVMSAYGFRIVNALVRDVDPAESVKQAMNQIQTQTRLRAAAEQEGEGKKILAVKAAEAEKETKKLQGEGIALEREAIAVGIKKSVQEITSAGENINATEAMRTLLLTQHYDALIRIGASSKATTIMLPYTPGSMTAMLDQMTTAMTVAGQVPGPDAAPKPVPAPVAKAA